MPDASQNTPRSGFTVDLSSGAGPAKPARPKGFAPVVQQTINLTTKKVAPQEPPPAAKARSAQPQSAQAPDLSRRSGAPKGGPARRDEAARTPSAPRGDARGSGDTRGSGGTSLADLLNEATLARLRGGA